MVKQSFSKIKKALPILLTFFFLATLTVASASASSSDPRFDEHGHWSIDGHHMKYDGQFWWDDIHHMKWDGHHWWDGHKWWDGHIWH